MRRRLAGCVLLLVVGGAGRADAASISFAAPGPVWRSFFGRPLAEAGIPDLDAIAAAAASTWEHVLLDTPAPLVVEIGLSRQLPDVTSLAATAGGPVRAFMAFDPGVDWFSDSTPLDDSEFAHPSVTSADLGGGRITTSIEMAGTDGPAASGFDLYSVALHELGHALGMNLRFVAGQGREPLVVADSLPAAGTRLPFIPDGERGAGHLALPGAVMWPWIAPGVRRLLSDADILAVAQAGGYLNVHLNPPPSSMPEPGTVMLVACGLAMLAGRRRRHLGGRRRGRGGVPTS